MTAVSRRGGFEVQAIRMPAAFQIRGVSHPAGSIVLHGPRGGTRVYSPEEFERLYQVTKEDDDAE